MKVFLKAWKNAFGFKGQKKTYGICLGAVLLTLLCTGCTFNPADNVEVAVYGPPPSFNTSVQNGDVELPEEDYDPSINMNADVYGPPEYFDDMDEPEDEDAVSDNDISDEEFDPADNFDVCVYGPPEDM